MKYRMLLLLTLVTSVSSVSVAGSNAKSYIPRENIGDFIVSTLDLASFRNSLGPRRSSGMHTFTDLGLSPTNHAVDDVIFDSKDWHYRVRVLERGDFNKDGIEDLTVCFQDRAKAGTYNVQQPLLLSRYDANGYLLALAFDLNSTPSCKKIHR